MSEPRGAPRTEASLRSLFTDILEDMRALIRLELELARTELGMKVRRAGIGLLSLLAGLALILFAVGFALQAAVAALTPWLGAAGAALAVAGATLGLGLIKLMAGVWLLKVKHLIPERSLASVRGQIGGGEGQ